MGAEAKANQAKKKSTITVHMSEKERMGVYLGMAALTPDGDDRQDMDVVCEKLNLDEFDAPAQDTKKFRDLLDEAQLYDLPGSAVMFLAKAFGKEFKMPAGNLFVSRMISRVNKRMVEAKDGNYEIPAELAPDAPAAPQPEAPAAE